ncbi:MAG TPA: spermidine/putrescine ABC transporter substrate-binding protein [Nocardioidaceae bacterium]|nr:spermidine/putrescine ABC transporter substrate-binding protein [Nocardioidaceae bacterium]
MVFHPREGRSEEGGWSPAISRRDLLKGAAGVGAAMGLSSVLAACGAGASGKPTASLPSDLARPNHPVKWPIYSADKPIASGLSPERNATLKLYNWTAYINKKVVKNFEKKYNCTVQITTFNTMDEALAKLQTGQLDFDVFIPTVDVLGPLIESKQLRPLNHSYIPNITQAWKEFQNPFYDQGWRYTVPYTIYTTGIAWRKDKVAGEPSDMSNPWAFPWQGKYKGRVAILDDYRESMSLGLLKNGITNLNTTDVSQLTAAKKSLLKLAALTDVHIDNNDWRNVPSGQIWIHHAWSGDMAAAEYYMPKGTPVSVVGYWFPSDGKGPVANDTMAVLAGGQNPVLAHLFLNYFLDLHNALENIGWNGYMQPLNKVTPALLIKEQILPKALSSTVVRESDFNTGLQELELPASARAVWQQDWLEVSQGG